MAQIDVLPTALTEAAAATRSFARAVEPVALRAGALSEALEDFTSAWTQAVVRLADDAEGSAARLQEAAEAYVQVESLLVPRALR